MRLKDLKTANRRKVVDVVLNHGPLSRIEISKAAGLSPSTVTGLVSSLLEDGLLIETGNKALTAGRSRTELSVNRNLGVIATLEVGRRSVLLTLFDLMLEPVHSETISPDSLEGNALLVVCAMPWTARLKTPPWWVTCSAWGCYTKRAFVPKIAW